MWECVTLLTAFLSQVTDLLDWPYASICVPWFIFLHGTYCCVKLHYVGLFLYLCFNLPSSLGCEPREDRDITLYI